MAKWKYMYGKNEEQQVCSDVTGCTWTFWKTVWWTDSLLLMKSSNWLLDICMCAQWLSHVRLFATPWTVACQAPLSMKFSRQEDWSGLPYPIPGVWMGRNKTELEAWKYLQQSGSKVINASAKRWQVFCRSKRDFMEAWKGFNNN